MPLTPRSLVFVFCSGFSFLAPPIFYPLYARLSDHDIFNIFSLVLPITAVSFIAFYRYLLSHAHCDLEFLCCILLPPCQVGHLFSPLFWHIDIDRIRQTWPHKLRLLRGSLHRSHAIMVATKIPR
jgi:hypothetical protein